MTDHRMDFAQIASTLANLPEGEQYPLEQWNPQDCGPLPLIIDREGQWWSKESNGQQTPYRRPALVKLLSQLLWCEPANYSPGELLTGHEPPLYSLRTPHESVSIEVEDVPFLVTDYQWETAVTSEQASTHNSVVMLCSTNLGDSVKIGLQHPIVVSPLEPNLPYVRVRRNLWARFNRNVYYRLINELLDQTQNDEPQLLEKGHLELESSEPETPELVIHSQGHRFIIAGGSNAHT